MTKILLIEDDEALANMYKIKLGQEGYEVVIAGDGEQGLEEAERSMPDVILLDLILPRKDGYEVLVELKKREETKGIKVFILSNLGQNGEVKKGKEQGAEGYFIKSNYTPAQLVEEVKKKIEASS